MITSLWFYEYVCKSSTGMDDDVARNILLRGMVAVPDGAAGKVVMAEYYRRESAICRADTAK